MDYNEARRWLNRAWRLEHEITALLQLRDETRARLLSATGALDGVIVAGSKDPHKYDGLVELEGRIDEMIDRQLAIKAEILNVCEKLEDTRLRALLINRFTRFMTWERIAVEMSYSWRQVMNLQRKAIEKAGEVIEHGHDD